jgi:ADP-ribose pyrophosphatase
MAPVRPLPPLPAISIDVARDRTRDASASGGFLNLRRLDLVVRYPDGTASAPFSYDVAVRAAMDVSAVVAHYVEAGVRHVYLRSSVRPPLALHAPPRPASQWEIAAGLIDEGETAAEAAARELEEELGFRAPASAMVPLGPPGFPVGGMCAEMHYHFHVEVDPRTRTSPSEDGSALERGAAIIGIPLVDALAHCRTGAIADTKTELALRRLAEVLGA